MRPETYQPLLFRFAVATACAALLPIVVGALVTTMKWGMAFLDWPSSDGHNMLLYPWLADIAAGRTDKAAEHGHRLAGILIGIVSIALAAVAWWKERRLWVRLLATAVLLAVVAQGILGGLRVVQNRQVLAMIHGGFAAIVFSLMGAVALFTSRSWIEPPGRDRTDSSALRRLKPLAVGAPLVIALQYALGGMLRHLGMTLHEHIGFAVLVLLVVAANLIGAHRSRVGWLRRPAWTLLALVLVQAALGLGAFVTNFGFAPSAYVAVPGSPAQVALSTAHTVTGMLVLMTSVVYALRVFRLEGASAWAAGAVETGSLGNLSAAGGAS